MREVRNRISQQHGIELSTQQIQDLAARRLEAILEPRNINPKLLEQLRKTAAAPPGPLPAAPEPDDPIADDAIYVGSPVVRFFRRLFNPLLKLLFNPAPLVAALQAQGRRNHAAAARAAELERLQTEWNALHYQILQRLVTEVSRASIEAQALSLRVESLAARVDFNDRRVRALENAPPSTRSSRPQELVAGAVSSAAPGASPVEPTSPTIPAVATADAPKRRRRRRRGRRAPLPGQEATATAAPSAVPDGDLDEGDEEETVEGMPAEPALPLPGPAPEPSPMDATTRETGGESAGESRPAPPPQPGEPNTPEQ